MIRQRMTLFNMTPYIYVASLPLIVRIPALNSRGQHISHPHIYICEV